MNRWGPAGSWPSPSTGSVRPFSRRRPASLVTGSVAAADLRQHPIVRQTYVVLGPLDFRSTGQHHYLSCVTSRTMTKVFRAISHPVRWSLLLAQKIWNDGMPVVVSRALWLIQAQLVFIATLSLRIRSCARRWRLVDC